MHAITCAQNLLEEKLLEAGHSGDRPLLDAALEAFRLLSAERFVCDEDLTFW